MIMDFFRQKGAPQDVPEQKASATGPVMAWHGAGRVAWSPRDNVTLTRTGFTGNPVGFRCVKMIAEAAASLPLVLQDAAQRYAEHPVLNLIKNPNPVQGKAELFEALYGQLLLTGNAYVCLTSAPMEQNRLIA